ncbi:helix-turn-helix transcriptional regulator [Psychromonas sp. MME2]|uniref:helix-turn-helix domain-containing protein n=1 Tax=unclassified Psychromonas TaxID=2614957 RepID=UPI00339CAE1E
MQALNSHQNTKQDMHRADIIAGLKKRGTSLAALARAQGYSSSTLQNALNSKWPKGERIIANALGLEPAEIWPSRYNKPAFGGCHA